VGSRVKGVEGIYVPSNVQVIGQKYKKLVFI